MKLLIRLMVISAATILLSGCLLMRPFHNQTIETTNSDFRVVAWIAQGSIGIAVGCLNPDYDYSKYVVDLHTVVDPGFHSGFEDSTGVHVNQMNIMTHFPDHCWEPVGDRYHTKLFVEYAGCHLGYQPCTKYFFNVDQAGQSCVTDSFWTSLRWLSWMSDSCYRKNPVTNEPEKTITVIANRFVSQWAR